MSLPVSAVNTISPLDASDNPFCTRWVRPGAIPFLFPPGENAEELADRLRQAGWWGEITGPHGSGKSALLAALTAAIEHAPASGRSLSCCTMPSVGCQSICGTIPACGPPCS